MIARVWRGSTLAEDADEYADYLEETGMKAARALQGSRGTLVRRRPNGGQAEFETILLFDSFADIHAFAGDDVAVAVFFPEDDRYLVEREPPYLTTKSMCTSRASLTAERQGPVAQPVFKTGEAS